MPPADTGGAHSEALAGFPMRRASFNGSQHTNPQTQRQRSRHACGPPAPADSSNRSAIDLGVHFDSFSSETALRGSTSRLEAFDEADQRRDRAAHILNRCKFGRVVADAPTTAYEEHGDRAEPGNRLPVMARRPTAGAEQKRRPQERPPQIRSARRASQSRRADTVDALDPGGDAIAGPLWPRPRHGTGPAPHRARHRFAIASQP